MFAGSEGLNKSREARSQDVTRDSIDNENEGKRSLIFVQIFIWFYIFIIVNLLTLQVRSRTKKRH